MKLPLFALAIILSVTAKSQDYLPCETKPIDSVTYFSWPWFGNNQFLIDLVDSIEGPRGKATTQQANYAYYIPVTAWVHHQGTNLTDNISNATVEQYINSLNTFMENNSSSIRFYLTCSINHITNSSYYDVPDANATGNMFNAYHTSNSFNIHFPFSSDMGGRGTHPWDNQDNIYTCYLQTGGIIEPWREVTLAHEVGHALGLLHTHNSRSFGQTFNRDCGNCYQESVSRTHTQGVACISTMGAKKCEVNGDCLCDTDADPGLIRSFANTAPLVDVNCNYDPQNTGWVNDSWNNAWNNNGNNNAITNIMSYGGTCRANMSVSQRGIQYYYMQQDGQAVLNHSSFYNNTWVDVFENDNNFENAHTIELEQCHEKTFHTIPSSTPEQNGTICDVDWIVFRPTTTGWYNVFTDYYSWTTDKADTKVTLYENPCSGCGLVFKGSNNDISSTDKRSRLNNRYMLSNFWYYIKIENGAIAPTTGFYLVCVNEGEDPGPQPWEPDVKLYPNPADFSATIECEDCLIAGIRVYDRNGIIKHQQDFDTAVPQYEWSVSSYEPGHYIVHVLVENTWQALTLIVQ